MNCAIWLTVILAQVTILTGIRALFADDDGIQSYTFDVSGAAAKDVTVHLVGECAQG